MKDETLKTIGRNHSVEQTKNAFYAARETGDFIINADLIAGLPEETPEEGQDNWMGPDELFEDITQTDETP